MTLLRDDLHACATQLTRLAGHGYSERERAAFVILWDDGRFDCYVWPNSFAWHRATFSGLMPKGTIAVIHTHPRGLPELSQHDFDEAKRLDIPVIAVTARSIAMARPWDARPVVVAVR